MLLSTQAKRSRPIPGLRNLDRVDAIQFSTAPSDGQVAIEQRLHNLIELAVSIGRRDGLFQHSKAIQKNINKRRSECHPLKEPMS